MTRDHPANVEDETGLARPFIDHLGPAREGHAGSYGRLVIGSGDGRSITPLAVRTAAVGMQVVVVTLASNCAWSLAKAAHRVIWRPVWPWTDPSAPTTTAA